MAQLSPQTSQPTAASSVPGASTSATGSSTPPSWQGKRLGRFKLISLLGQGAMGKVFRATDVQLHRDVALKVLSKSKDGKRTVQQEQFIREARAAANLDHPHIVRVFEINQEGPYVYIAMELLEGGDLGSLVDAAGPMDVPRACQLIAEAAEALAAAHAVGVVHRDIKPANLMLSRHGRCKLVDFGLADLGDASDGFRLRGKAIGTAHYMAPEVVDGESATPLSDQYSLACTLWHVLLGTPPFSGQTVRGVLISHLQDAPPDAKALRPDLPDSLIKALHRAMEKNPAERFENAGMFAKALRVHTVPVGSPMADQRAATAASAHDRTKPVVLWGGIAAGVAGLLVAGIVVVNSFGSRPSPALPLPNPVSVRVPSPAAPKPSPAPSRPVLASPARAEVIEATDSARLLEFARREAQGIVRGRVKTAATSATGKVFTVEFEGVGRDGFNLAYFPRMFEPMQAKFGGTNGSGLSGKAIEVSGLITLFRDQPQIVIDDADQVRLAN
jgi:serine/threonine-protein kinase